LSVFPAFQRPLSEYGNRIENLVLVEKRGTAAQKGGISVSETPPAPTPLMSVCC
jgi:hypothetical protein